MHNEHNEHDDIRAVIRARMRSGMGPGGPGGPGGRGRGGGRGGPRRRPDVEQIPANPVELAGWFAGRRPDDLFIGPPSIKVDRDEIVVVGPVAAPTRPEGETSEAWTGPAESARIERFREDTRGARMQVADAAEARFGRKVSWGATCGSTTEVFTSLSLPMMTRLRFDDRAVLDTLVDANVARSRSDALGWCVRLVAEHQAEWIDKLREALADVDKVRAQGPETPAE